MGGDPDRQPALLFAFFDWYSLSSRAKIDWLKELAEDLFIVLLSVALSWFDIRRAKWVAQRSVA